MTGENTRENAQASVHRAEQELAIARNCLRDGFFHATVSHAYYAAFHYALALLFTEGLQTKTHSGVAHLVNLAFVRKGLMPPKVFCILGHLQRDREVADYDAMCVYDDETAQDAIDQAMLFRSVSRSILTDRIDVGASQD